MPEGDGDEVHTKAHVLLPRRAAPQKLASLDEYFVKDLRAEKHESKARGLAEEKREGAAIEESC